MKFTAIANNFPIARISISLLHLPNPGKSPQAIASPLLGNEKRDRSLYNTL
ncbi:hypothetical protein H6F74_03715 [Trichocoleus sp. FACHB-90]|uniref:hypothetical protein n=1 Tax=Cyanophyceae TaxID=3028117 RepID=UPI0016848BA3|nr:hypothetical protein [Trichocoleus sp. FACHB-90]MBD1925396.1 hypothetical protein [Trichocoleus sp. FACHB-90]